MATATGDPQWLLRLGADARRSDRGVAHTLRDRRPCWSAHRWVGSLVLRRKRTHAPLFRALVLVDVTPRWETSRCRSHSEVHARASGRIRVARRGRRSGRGPSAASVSAASGPSGCATCCAEHGDGRLRWHWDPRLLDEIAAQSAGHQPRLLEAARGIRIPTLLISGGASDIVSGATIDEFLALVPHAHHVSMPAATHMIVGDDNVAFTGHVVDFLRALTRIREFSQ